MTDIKTRIQNALGCRDEAGNFTVTTRSLLRHLLSESLAAIEALEAEIARLRTDLGALEIGYAFIRKTEARFLAERDALKAERDEAQRNYERACLTIADMHAAATGQRDKGPTRGVVEDVADLKAERDRLWAERLASDMVLAGEIETTGLSALEEACRERDTLKAEIDVLRAALEAIKQMPCITALLGDDLYLDSCGCASCVANHAVTALSTKRNRDDRR